MEDANFFWKSFRLGNELHISGTFIYNALNYIDKLEDFQFEEDIFEILYNLSVGIERLEKIVIILMEHQNTLDTQEEFERSLITHNHLDLMARIRKTEKLDLSNLHNKFLQLLSNFYNSYRYERFNRNSVYHPNYDKSEFNKFIIDELKLGIDEIIGCIKNDYRIKKFIGKIVGKITKQLYELVGKYSNANNTFTWEIRYPSKAFKIFIEKEFTFEKENNFKKEILISLINNGFNDEFINMIKLLEPLKLTYCNLSYYIKYLLNSDCVRKDTIEEYNNLIASEEIPKNRASDIEFIGYEIDYPEDFGCLDTDLDMEQ